LRSLIFIDPPYINPSPHFVVDRAGFIREIYSSTFPHPQTVLNDTETLLIEEGAESGTKAAVRH
jgi:hypothetical protein